MSAGWVGVPFPAPHVEVCYLLVASWVQVFRFMVQLNVRVGIIRMHMERLMASVKSLQGTRKSLSC